MTVKGKRRRTTASARLPKGFTDRKARVNGVTISYKIGGHGPAVVLLHGYAQTSHMWRPLMPLLAPSHTVIAPDLRGAGCSARPPAGYDKKTMARDVHGLVRRLGQRRVTVVGHDIGLMVAYAYAAQYPGEVERVVLMDAFLPGVGKWQDVWLLRDLWHFHFYGKTPLALVKGRERIYFEHFWNDFAADPKKSIPEADRRIYAAAYARADGMRAGFEFFRAFEQDARDFAAFSKTKLSMPFLVLTGEKASGTFLIEQARIVATNVSGVVVKGAGHWLMEEATRQVVPAITRFIG
jgi:pimeloyl-ACP methyl ester carboxylesterase